MGVRLLVGPPGVGKSTIVARVVEALGPRGGGFFTREVREAGERVGFEIVTLDGRVAPLATTRAPSGYAQPHPFGRYTVNLEALDRMVVPLLREAAAARRIVVVDEIGPMELLSERFAATIMELLEGEQALFGTIVARSHPLADRIKAHPRVTLLPVTRENRERLTGELRAAYGERGTDQR